MMVRLSRFFFFIAKKFSLIRGRLLFRFFLCYPGNGRAGDFKNRLVCASDEETGITDRRNSSDYSARGNDTIARLELGNRLLQLFLPFLLRPDQEHIEDAYNKEHGDESAKCPKAALKYH
jgi:hypothetical protein